MPDGPADPVPWWQAPAPSSPPPGPAGAGPLPPPSPPVGSWGASPPAVPPWGAPAPPSAPAPRRRPVGLLVVGALVIGAAVGVVAGTLARASGPDHPDEWDPRLTELVAFVEDVKGEPFEHPVHVEFLDEADFDAERSVADADLTDEDRAALADSEGMLRALGVASGEVGLLDAFNQLETGGTLAYYDDVEDRIVMEGTELDVALSVTVVHELTHAWQDQHYGLERDFDDPGAEEAFRAIAEGDATRVENVYVDELSEEDLAAYDDRTGEQLEAYDTDGVPSLLVADESAPYAIGTPFLDAMAASGDEVEVLAGVFDRPPSSTEQLLDPVAYLADDPPVEVATPDVPGGGDALDEGTFGALSLFLLVADRLEPMEALAVADAWEGDAYALGTDGDRACVALAVELEAGDIGSDGEPRRSAADAVAAWAEQLPDATVDSDGSSVEVVACDPGPDVAIDVVGRSEDVLGYPVVRLYLLAGFVDQGMDLEVASQVERADCLITGFLGAIPVEEMASDEADEDRSAELMEAAVAACAP